MKPQCCKKNCKQIIKTLWIILFIAAILIPFLLLHFTSLVDYFVKEDDQEIALLIYFATLIIACIAYYQLSRSNEFADNEFILHISKRWGDKTIIKARMILHALFQIEYRSENTVDLCKHCHYERSLRKIADNILTLSRETNDQNFDFIYLLNLLDFMETLGFFWKERNLDIEIIDGLYGNSILFFYKCFKVYIKNRQQYEKNSYINFCQMAKKIKNLEEVPIECLYGEQGNTDS